MSTVLETSRIVVVHDSSCWAATPETARGSTRNALTTAPANRVVSLARAGNWSVVSVNVRRAHSSSAQTYRRLRTSTVTAPPQCRSLTRWTGRACTREVSTPARGAGTLGLLGLDQHHPVPVVVTVH